MENMFTKLQLGKDRKPEQLHIQCEANYKDVVDKISSPSPGQKLCKECGLPFTPKGRESYCTREHYRPCPVCQKPVLIKYLSDPTPCCSKECTKAKRSGAKKMVAPSTTTPDHSFSNFTAGEQRQYVGKDGVMGLRHGHVYSIEIDRDPIYHNYQITATYDHTEDKSCDHTITCCSMLNINKNVFRKLDANIADETEEETND